MKYLSLLALVFAFGCGGEDKKCDVLFIGALGVVPIQAAKSCHEVNAGFSHCGYNYSEAPGVTIRCLNPIIVRERDAE